MSEFRLTQISDSHLSRRHPTFVENFDRVSEHIASNRPDLVVNSGDVSFDGPDNADDLSFAKAKHDALPVDCRYIPGNHDIGDNRTEVAPALLQAATEERRQAFLAAFGEDHWRFDAAGWCFIGLNSLVMNTAYASDAAQFAWLEEQLAGLDGRPLALFIHKPLFKNSPDEPELTATSFRYVPKPARGRLVGMLDGVNLRLVASGHVHQRKDQTFGSVRHIWAPSTGFIIRSNEKQELIGIKETGLVEYRFRPDGFDVNNIRAHGQIDIDLHATPSVLAVMPGG